MFFSIHNMVNSMQRIPPSVLSGTSPGSSSIDLLQCLCHPKMCPLLQNIQWASNALSLFTEPLRNYFHPVSKLYLLPNPIFYICFPTAQSLPIHHQHYLLLHTQLHGYSALFWTSHVFVPPWFYKSNFSSWNPLFSKPLISFKV